MYWLGVEEEKPPRGEITEILLNDVPDCVWMTIHDIQKIVAYYWPDFDKRVTHVMVSQYVRDGRYIKKKNTDHRKNIKVLYKRQLPTS